MSILFLRANSEFMVQKKTVIIRMKFCKILYFYNKGVNSNTTYCYVMNIIHASDALWAVFMKLSNSVPFIANSTSSFILKSEKEESL